MTSAPVPLERGGLEGLRRSRPAARRRGASAGRGCGGIETCRRTGSTRAAGLRRSPRRSGIRPLCVEEHSRSGRSQGPCREAPAQHLGEQESARRPKPTQPTASVTSPVAACAMIATAATQASPTPVTGALVARVRHRRTGPDRRPPGRAAPWTESELTAGCQGTPACTSAPSPWTVSAPSLQGTNAAWPRRSPSASPSPRTRSTQPSRHSTIRGPRPGNG